jgi:hypothetical protein
MPLDTVAGCCEHGNEHLKWIFRTSQEELSSMELITCSCESFNDAFRIETL